MSQGIYKRKSQIDFDKILQLVIDGYTIENALFSSGWKYTSYFYRHVTEEQKEIIYRAKMLHSKGKKYY